MRNTTKIGYRINTGKAKKFVQPTDTKTRKPSRENEKVHVIQPGAGAPTSVG